MLFIDRVFERSQHPWGIHRYHTLHFSKWELRPSRVERFTQDHVAHWGRRASQSWSMTSYHPFPLNPWGDKCRKQGLVETLEFRLIEWICGGQVYPNKWAFQLEFSSPQCYLHLSFSPFLSLSLTHTHMNSLLGDVNWSLKWALDGNYLIRLITVN